jgi:NADP-dependent 3-hydroxy acid dehydrogenase YdfG
MTRKTLFLTGASTGIGRATALAAAEAGWNVGLAARSADKLSSLADALGDRGLAVPCDVTDFAAVEEAVAKTVDHFGGLHAAFANAGRGIGPGGTEGGDPADWHDLIHVNILGVLHTAKAALPHLKPTKGTMVLTGSAAGKAHMKGSIYGATKWFVHGYGGNLALEMRAWGGRCAVIAPGMVDTPFFDQPKPDKIQPEDVARAVLHAIDAPATVAVREIFLMPNDPA